MAYTVKVGEDSFEFPDSVTQDQAKSLLLKHFNKPSDLPSAQPSSPATTGEMRRREEQPKDPLNRTPTAVYVSGWITTLLATCAVSWAGEIGVSVHFLSFLC